MTAPAGAPAQGTTPLRVSVEGVNGVGKTTAARSAAAMLGARCLLLDELTDQPGDTLPGRVIGALAAGKDPFLRGGHPVAETLALLALHVRKAEWLAGRDLAGVDVIIEDRGVDTVVVYQSVIMCSQSPGLPPEEVARHVLSATVRWRPLPDATILLTGDLSVCARRFAGRIGQPLAPADLQVIDRIDALYRTMAARDPRRYTSIDVARLSPGESASAVSQVVATLLAGRQAARAA
jgi:dTMP kinase